MDVSKFNVLGEDIEIKDTKCRTQVNSIIETIEKINKYIISNGGWKYTDIQKFEIGNGKAYANPVDAFNSADKTKPAVFLLHEGEYDVSSASDLGLRLYNYWYLVGVGTKEKCHIYYYANSNEQYKSVINTGKNCGISNVFLSGSKTRYVIHDDFDETFGESFYRFFDNCIIEGSDLTFKYPLGGGLKGGCHVKMTNCLVINGSTNVCVSWHNMAGEQDNNLIELYNNTFYCHGQNTIRLSTVSEYDTRVGNKETHVIALNNSNNSFIFDLEWGTGNPFTVRCNGLCYFTAGTGQTIYWNNIENDDMFIKRFPYLASYPVGIPVFVDGNNSIASLTNINAMLVEGILLTTTKKTNQNVIAIKRGKIPASYLFGSAQAANQWINYIQGAPGTISCSTERGTAIGYIDTQGNAVIDPSLR